MSVQFTYKYISLMEICMPFLVHRRWQDNMNNFCQLAQPAAVATPQTLTIGGAQMIDGSEQTDIRGEINSRRVNDQ